MKNLSMIKTTMMFLIFCASNIHAQSEMPYTGGPVWNITFVRTKQGMERNYLQDLSNNWAKLGKVAKSEGIIMDYKLIAAPKASPTDWDLMLLIEVKNYAALDGMNEKFDALAAKLFGTEEKQHQNALNRNDMREILSEKLGQELIFK
ncbi:MAG: hypothetical protein J5I59_12485 [Saprospiraceae bacterium]|nr:hypothetical protein [Saprospiraceae bacterium]